MALEDRDIWPTIAFRVCFPSPLIPEDERHTGRQNFKDRLDEIDPSGEIRRLFATLPADKAHEWHINDDDIAVKLGPLVERLDDGIRKYTVGAVLSVCYHVVNGQIVCDHCYILKENNEPIEIDVPVGGNILKATLAICYSWPSPFSS